VHHSHIDFLSLVSKRKIDLIYPLTNEGESEIVTWNIMTFSGFVRLD